MVQSRRNAKAALRFFKKLLKHYEQVPRVIITDKIASYAAAKDKILKGVEHRRHKGLNNKIEVAHEPTRLREKQMRRFHSPRHAQKFLSKFGVLKNFFKIVDQLGLLKRAFVRFVENALILQINISVSYIMHIILVAI